MSRTGGGGAGGRGPPPKDLDRPTRTGTYDLFGLNMEFLRQHNIEPPLCERIFIANVGFKYSSSRRAPHLDHVHLLGLYLSFEI